MTTDALTAFASSDPDFVDFFGAFAFTETADASNLAATDRHVVQLGALVGGGSVDTFEAALEAALDDTLTPIQAKEIVYQAAAYAGAGRTLAFLTATNNALRRRGVTLPLSSQRTTTPDDRLAVGRAKQGEIVGSANVDGLYANATEDTLRFQRFLSANCFGDYYTRDGLSTKQRELLTFAILVSIGGADGQVKSHVTANLTVGNSRAHLLDVLTALVPWVGYPRTLNGLAAVNDAAPAAG